MANPNPTSVKVTNPTPKAAPTKSAKTTPSTTTKPVSNIASNYELRWKTLLGLTMIALELALNTGFIWGIFGLFWAITNIQNGQTYVLEPLHRANNPILFWITVWLWMGFAAYFFYSNSWVFKQLEQALVWLIRLLT